MTRDDIIRMVRECADEIRDERGRVTWEMDIYGLEKFVDLIAPAQRGCASEVHDRREWQGLTDEEVGMLTVFDGLHHVEIPLLANFVRAIEAKLKEKNNDTERN